MRAHHYLELVGGMVVGRHGIGPDRQPDGTEAYPPVPAEWLPITFEQYMDTQIGSTVLPNGTIEKPSRKERSRKIDDKLIRLAAKQKDIAAKADAKLLTKVGQLQDQIDTLTEQVRLQDLAFKAKLNKLDAQIAKLGGRITVLEGTP